MNKTSILLFFFILLVLLISACTEQPADQYPDSFADPTGFFPTLTDPEGAHRPGGGGGGNPDKRGLGFDLVTDLPIDQVHDFYANQLKEAGWKIVSQKEEDGLISSYWELLDDNGKTWPVMLEVSTETISDMADYNIELRAVSPP
jgi:uncharacterized lipoprotein